MPVRWEEAHVPEHGDDVIDERLWFVGPCGGRDLVLDDNGHTFPGRMLAWCAQKDVVYRVSLDEMGEMSEATRWFVKGFLAGALPPPNDLDGEPTDEDVRAWDAAARRFQRSGTWSIRWRTCGTCGAVLLPGTIADR